ncbi:MAG: toll/interleukin-1 receptor domain-containing protein, partial [Clostridiales Family XIII bacterium]|nr:toll/interleukin-1 receptor domain-containing protein [Clostridiales Family XIII bacterium]
LPVFCDDFMLEPGDDLEDRIRNGITQYKFGIVILSRAFVRIGWQAAGIRCLYEELSSEYKDLYPVWHNITRNDLANFLPVLERFIPEKHDAGGIPAIVRDVVRLLWPNPPSDPEGKKDVEARF